MTILQGMSFNADIIPSVFLFQAVPICRIRGYVELKACGEGRKRGETGL